MNDNFGRIIDYLRISLTDRCNFRCKYCMPADGIKLIDHRKILSLEEIVRLAEISAELGIRKIRLTGGEPLVRKGLISLIGRLSSIVGIDSISMTTNGFLLESMVKDLKDNGLDRLNISLDTINREKFKNITGIDGLDSVLKGIDCAIETGFHPIKLNTVAIRGINDTEIIGLAEYAASKKLILRFIEQMPFNSNDKKNYISATEIIERLSSKLGKASVLNEKDRDFITGSGPASMYQFGDKGLVIGFITPISNHFCSSCNRIRVTADGKLKPCLLSNEEIDLREKMRDGSSNEDIKKILSTTIRLKPERHNLNRDSVILNRGMSKIGG